MVHLVIPGIPPTWNREKKTLPHIINREKNYWLRRVEWIASHSRKPESPIVRSLVRYTFYFKNEMRRDYSNMYGAIKILEDGLKQSGFLAEDSTSHTYPLAWIGGYDRRERVEIEIYPLDQMKMVWDESKRCIQFM